MDLKFNKADYFTNLWLFNFIERLEHIESFFKEKQKEIIM
jgi:hypothetical protein